jgi:hypothetical protein
LLHYFIVTCKPAVAGMSSMSTLAFSANVSCVAAEAFITCNWSEHMCSVLLAATKKYYDEMKTFAAGRPSPVPIPDAERPWIKFGAAAAKAKATMADAARMMPKVIAYDVSSGAPVNAQDSKLEEQKTAGSDVVIPWKQWLTSSVAQDLDAVASDMAAITLVLRSLHCQGHVETQAIEVSYDLESRLKTVTATSDLEPDTLELPPCVPKSGKVYTTSVHPLRVPIRVTRKAGRGRSGGEAAFDGRGNEVDPIPTACDAVRTYYLHPEYKLPEDTATTETKGSLPGTVLWEFKGDETLHPFWAVPRLNDAEMNTKNLANGSKRAFNMKMEEKEYVLVTVGELYGESVAITISVSIPLLTNADNVYMGDQLIMKAVAQAHAKKRR